MLQDQQDYKRDMQNAVAGYHDFTEKSHVLILSLGIFQAASFSTDSVL